MTQPAHVIYRAPTTDDVSFIYSSWLKSMRSSDWAKFVPTQIFFDNHKKVVAALLEVSHVLIACNPEHVEQIFGYAVFQPSAAGVAIVHYLYVKHPYRRLGIGREILETLKRIADHDKSLPVVFTHRTSAMDVVASKWNAIYNPYLIGADTHDEDRQHKAS